MTRWTQRDEILKSVRFFSGCESFEWNLMMHIMLTRRFNCVTNLACISITRMHPVTDLAPVRTIVVRVVGPDSSFAQTRYRLFGERKPIASRLQFGGRQLQRF